MPINVRDAINVVSDLHCFRDLKVTVRNSMLGGFITGCTTMLGGIVMGPIGLAVGGAIGGMTSALKLTQFKSVPQVLSELSSEQREVLYARLMNIIGDVQIEDAAMLASFLLTNELSMSLVMEVVTEFITNDLSLALA